MSDATADSLRRQLDDVQARYAFRFAGKPRATRELRELDELISAARQVGEQARGLGDSELFELANERVAAYDEERTQIIGVQSGGPRVKQAAQLGMRANLVFGLYRRHFAGKSRLTRDVALLDDIIEQLRAIQGALRDILSAERLQIAEDHIGVVERQIELYVAEHEAITAAQAAAEGSNRTGMLAQLANLQFTAYRAHFAGKPRVSRRPPLLERILATLGRVGQEMTSLVVAGVETETNEKNLAIVNERKGAYAAELKNVEQARSGASIFELIDALGQAANAVFEEYAQHFAGQDRKTRNLEQLTDMCDRLQELERQMTQLGAAYDHAMNARNVNIVQDTALTYQAEWERIREVQAGATPASSKA
jgi:hypothetical protein